MTMRVAIMMKKIMTVQSIDDDCEYIKKIISDNENNNEEADDNDGEGTGDGKVIMMVVVMIAAKNMMTMMKKVTVKRLTIVIVGVMTMNKH